MFQPPAFLCAVPMSSMLRGFSSFVPSSVRVARVLDSTLLLLSQDSGITTIGGERFRTGSLDRLLQAARCAHGKKPSTQHNQASTYLLRFLFLQSLQKLPKIAKHARTAATMPSADFWMMSQHCTCLGTTCCLFCKRNNLACLQMIFDWQGIRHP